MMNGVMWVILTGIVAFPNAGQAAAEVSRLVGTYKECLVGCMVIMIRPDHTFSYQPMSDVGAPEVFEGKWEFEADNILLANTFDQPEGHSITSATNGKKEGVTVRVLDLEGKPLPLAKVKLSTDRGVLTQETDENGNAQFPSCVPSYLQAKSDYSQFTNSVKVFDLTSRKGNLFEVRIPRSSFFITNQRWLVQDGKLYIISSEPLRREK